MVFIFGSKKLEELKEEDIQRLIDIGEVESIILEFKRDLSNNTKEIAKDISSMANSEGGIILYGISEDGNGKIDSIDWIDDSLGFQERIENILSATINPFLVFKIFQISKKNDDTKKVYLVLVPKSNNLHMVIKDNDNRYYKRVGTTIQRMGDREIKERISVQIKSREDTNKKIEDMNKEFHNYTGENLVSVKRIHYYVIPTSLEKKVNTLGELKIICDSIRNDFCMGINFESYSGTIATRNYSDSNKWKKCSIIHPNGIIEFRRLGDMADIFASHHEAEILSRLINFANDFYKKINYFGEYKIILELGNVGKFAFENTLENSSGVYTGFGAHLIEEIEIEPFITQNTLKNNNQIYDLIKRIGGYLDIEEGSLEQLRVKLGV